MRTRRPRAGEQSLPEPEYRLINPEHLEIVARVIASLKSELDAGTPIDHKQIAQLEEQLNKLQRQPQSR
jgi:hypothetical protein